MRTVLSLFNDVLSVSKANEIVAKVISKCSDLENIKISGEIANFTWHSSGHIYLTLKDKESRLKCVMFKNSASSLAFVPTEGMEVVCNGSIKVYERGGEYQLYIDKMELAGSGSLSLAFERLKARLSEEGLFDQSMKRNVPKDAKKIVVITSPTGAAIKDVISVAVRRNPAIHVVLVPALVQGEGAPESVIKALKSASDIPEVDCIILTRGGGSAEELWAFNDEGIARAIRNASYPVISAIGHEIDFTIADFASDLRAPTPSAAAEMVVSLKEHMVSKIDGLKSRMLRELKFAYREQSTRFELIKKSRCLTSSAVFDDRKIYLDELYMRMVTRAKTYMDYTNDELNRYIELFNAYDPNKVLKRGYSIVTDAFGKVVCDSEKTLVGDRMNIKLYRGSLNVVIDEKISENKKQL